MTRPQLQLPLENLREQDKDMGVEHMLRASEVAHMLGVTPKRVYVLVGHIAVRYAPRTMRWRPSDVRFWIEAHRSKNSI
jgi:predicted DNA-binding transcriptional regulator AlpA